MFLQTDSQQKNSIAFANKERLQTVKLEKFYIFNFYCIIKLIQYIENKKQQ